jgi:hypothetical protein
MRYVEGDRGRRLRGESVFLSMPSTPALAHHPSMPTFLIEIHIADAGDREVDRAVRLLNAAQTRLRDAGTDTRTTVVGLVREDGRLVCLVDAPDVESARRLVGLALLPGGRVREITHLAETLSSGSDPGSDARPRAEAELVEDVVDVRLDGALREE